MSSYQDLFGIALRRLPASARAGRLSPFRAALGEQWVRSSLAIRSTMRAHGDLNVIGRSVA